MFLTVIALQSVGLISHVSYVHLSETSWCCWICLIQLRGLSQRATTMKCSKSSTADSQGQRSFKGWTSAPATWGWDLVLHEEWSALWLSWSSLCFTLSTKSETSWHTWNPNLVCFTCVVGYLTPKMFKSCFIFTGRLPRFGDIILLFLLLLTFSLKKKIGRVICQHFWKSTHLVRPCCQNTS